MPIRRSCGEPTTGKNRAMTPSTVCATTTCFSTYRFTGKERDAESGNDYFEARYYASSMGRFMSPDWSAKAEPVPYAKLGDPQTLNLYAYVGNNPLIHIDADGHCWPQWLCNIGQAINNGVHGLGWQTNAGVEKEQYKAKQTLRNNGILAEGMSQKQMRNAYHLTLQIGGVRTGTGRPTAAQARAIWEKATGGKVPWDDSMSRFYDMAHNTPISDGGNPTDPANLKPQLHSEHMQEHSDNGDFARWGMRGATSDTPTGGEVPAGEVPVGEVPVEMPVEVPIEIPIF